MYLISSCLVGTPCRYDGQSKKNEAVCNWLANQTQGKDYLLICPEAASGLPIPRPAAEIENGDAAGVLSGKTKICTQQGEDYTASFLKGALLVADLAQRHQATLAVLKEKSPSCGVHLVYDGQFHHKTMPGMGLTAFLLQQQQIKLFTEETFADLLKSKAKP